MQPAAERRLSAPERAADLTARGLGILMGIGLMVMVVLVLGNVVLRYGFNSGITVAEELSRWIFVWITFLGAVVAQRSHAHLGTDALVSRVSVKAKKALMVLGHVIMLGICGLLFQGSLEQTKINWAVLAPSSQLPLAIVYSAGLVFSVLTALVLLLDLWLLLTGRLADDKLVLIRETEDAHELPHAAPAPGTPATR